MSEELQKNDADTKSEPVAEEMISKPSQTEVPPVVKSRGGFMGGGLATTFLFLMAFFLVSYSLGVLTERNNKLSSAITKGAGGAVAGAQQEGQGGGNFTVDGFKKLAKDIKLDTKKFDTCLDQGKFADLVKKEQSEGAAVGVQGTPSFIINGVAIVGAQPLSIFEQALQGNPPAAPSGNPGGLADGQRIDKQIAIDSDTRIEGDKNAKITIVEFSDFQCPFCARFYSDSYKSIRANYIKTGKAKLIYKDYPLSFHPQAQKAAEAGRCAAEQGKFWEMHDKLFELQLEG